MSKALQIKFKGVWGKLELKNFFKRQSQSLTKYLGQTLVFMFFRRFLLVMTKFSFRYEGCTLGINSMKFWVCPNYLRFFKSYAVRQLSRLLLITFYFACGERKICSTIQKSQKYLQNDCSLFLYKSPLPLLNFVNCESPTLPRDFFTILVLVSILCLHNWDTSREGIMRFLKQ